MHGQETWGASNSNFAGIMGLGLNPSSIVQTPYSSEFCIISLDNFVENNYVYLKKGYGIFNSTSAPPESNSAHGATGDYYTVTPPKKAYASSYIFLPSFIRNYGREAWAIHGGIRTAFSAKDIPYHLAKFIYEGFNYKPQQQINFTSGPFELEGMSWYEVGGTYARVLSRNSNNRNIYKVGITANLLLGTNSMFLQEDNIDYIVPQDGLLIVNNVNAKYGHALPENYSNAGSYFGVRGLGPSANIGITYTHKLNKNAYTCRAAASSLPKYDYRIGVSLIDVGFITFNSRDAATFKFVDNSTFWPGFDTVSFKSWNAMDTMLSNRFYGNPTESADKKVYSVFLPTAASLQFDYNIMTNFFVNATVVQRMPLSDLSIIRPNQISLTGRYEKRKFELDLPISYYDYDKVAVGFAVRWGAVTIGTDRLGAYTGLFEATGFDFFFALRWTRCEQGERANKTSCPVKY
jgi:hypothetical protein